ncbi:MAG: YkgJ family cysteine cluster protein [Moraxella sp.]
MSDFFSQNCTVKNNQLRPNFWRLYPLGQLNSAEWEALCDGCGVCCLVKYLDDTDVRFTEYTDVACQLLNTHTGLCSNYLNRQKFVPDCITLTYQMLPDMLWLPKHCAYKRLYLGQNLPSWHRLVADENTHQTALKKVGAAGRCVSELNFTDEEMEERVVKWVSI